MDGNRANLIVVYKDKDELALNLLRKLIEGKDDIEGEGIVGTEDDSIALIAWNEKIWLDNKKAGNICSKILFIGNVKGVENLIPIIDIKYNKYGIVYGWSGSQAVITVDSKSLKKKEEYDIFINDLRNKTNISIAASDKKVSKNKKTILKLGGTLTLPFIWPVLAGRHIKGVFDDKALVRKQQFLLGISELYLNHLDAFMKG
ncbi:hypothetical protein MCJ35_07735 [Enterocloster sp. OA13]|uniref:hypothetical protein n=1 Tax=Enterocloster sp. OA13 TaxID=2914161 RepID=UPI000472D96F|nr:hypothetical protein [Enterocloster sp. OA13]